MEVELGWYRGLFLSEGEHHGRMSFVYCAQIFCDSTKVPLLDDKRSAVLSSATRLNINEMSLLYAHTVEMVSNVKRFKYAFSRNRLKNSLFLYVH